MNPLHKAPRNPASEGSPLQTEHFCVTQVWKYTWLCEPHADQDQALVGRRVIVFPSLLWLLCACWKLLIRADALF